MTVIVASNKIEMTQGDNATLKQTILYDNNTLTPVNLTGCKIWFSVKKNYTDTSYEFQRRNTLAGGGDTEIKITNATAGECEIYIIPSNTSSVRPSNYVYDVQISHPTHGIKTVTKNRIFIKEQVTTD